MAGWSLLNNESAAKSVRIQALLLNLAARRDRIVQIRQLPVQQRKSKSKLRSSQENLLSLDRNAQKEEFLQERKLPA